MRSVVVGADVGGTKAIISAALDRKMGMGVGDGGVCGDCAGGE